MSSALFRHFWTYDLELVGRDRFLSFVPAYLVVIVPALRFGVPPLTHWLRADYGFDLEPYWPLIGSYVSVLLSSMFIGILVGFLLLDEREQGTLRARLVTPLAFEGFLVYRIAQVTLAAVVTLPFIAYGLGLGAPSLSAVVVLALANAPMAVVGTLFFPLFTRDKVQAFAWGKLLSGICFLPLAATLLDSPWHWVVGGWMPVYWTLEAYLRAESGEPWVIHAATGGLTTWLLAAWMVRLYRRAVHRG